LKFPDQLSGSWLGYAQFNALVDLQSTATSYLGLDANFSLLARMSAWNELGL
jgi:hypothetical protein